ncbi:MAG: DUF3185 domain-containing protein [Candidatus Melainabacteria bacterium]|nr:DUF3185 domain-containing protein [Candidatus Melainabacteria bacterium]
MKSILLIVGVLLAIGGVAALSLPGITVTSQEKVLDIGPLQATTTKEETVPIPQPIGIAATVGGLLLVVVALRRGG